MLRKFPAIKLKCGSDAKATVKRMGEVATKAPDSVLRLDFNGCLDATGYRRFVEMLPDELRVRVDLVEDPIPYDAGVWRELPGEMPLAVDRGSETATKGFAIRVLKPAGQETRLFPEPVVVTSYMDHPLGQAFAAYEAATYRGKLHGAGLLTHWCFEPEEFGARLSVEEGRLCPPLGTGLGFNDLLEKLPWKQL